MEIELKWVLYIYKYLKQIFSGYFCLFKKLFLLTFLGNLCKYDV